MAKNLSHIFGVNPVLEMLRALPRDVLEILIAEGVPRHVLDSIESKIRHGAVPVCRVPSSLLDRLASGQRHQGVAAKIREFRYTNFADLLSKLASAPQPQWVLLLDGLTDPRNFGAVLRTAEAVGVRQIIIPKDRSVRVSPLVVSASAGAVHHLDICLVTNLRRAIEALKQKDYWIVGLDAEAETSLFTMTYPRRLGIILGSEGSGIRSLIRKECDFIVKIPMFGNMGSLNVAVAGAVFLYELLRRRIESEGTSAKG